MRYRDDEVNRMWVALQAAKQRQLMQALQVAQEAAWGDLPQNEREKYLQFGLKAVKEEEKEAVN